MKGKIALLALTSVALVAGCNRGATNNSTASTNATEGTNMAAPAAPAPADSGAVDSAFVTGHWGVAGDCSRTLSFNADGTATATGEDDPVRWTLDGTTMTTTEGDNAPERATIARNGDMMVVTPEGGDTMSLTRCATPAAAEPGAPPAGAAPSN